MSDYHYRGFPEKKKIVYYNIHSGKINSEFRNNGSYGSSEQPSFHS